MRTLWKSILTLTAIGLATTPLSAVQAAPGEAPAAAPAVAHLLRVRGSVRVQRPGTGSLAARDFYRLRPGDRLLLDAGASAEAVFFQLGQRAAVRGACLARVTASGLRMEPGPGGARPAAPRVSPTDATLARLAGKPPSGFSRKLYSGTTRGLSGLCSPEPVGAIEGAGGLAEPVELRWENRLRPAPEVDPGAVRLLLEVAESPSGRAVLVERLPLGASWHRLPAGRLRPGQLYTWSVSVLARGVGSHRTGGLLWLLTPEERAEAAELERAARAAPAGDAAAALLLALGCERLGLAHRAAEAYRAVLDLDPENRGAREALEALERLLDRPQETRR